MRLSSLCLLCLPLLTACDEQGRLKPAEPPPYQNQPSTVDKAIEPLVQRLGGRIGPTGGIIFDIDRP